MMWRYWLGGGGAIAAVAAALLWTARETPSAALPPAPAPVMAADDGPAIAGAVPESSPQTREQRRFGRYDKDRDGAITRTEYLASRRKAFAKLDADGDGRLSFDEWSAKTQAKFDAADRDRSGAMSAEEFATTAVRRRPARAAKCPPTSQPAEES